MFEDHYVKSYTVVSLHTLHVLLPQVPEQYGMSPMQILWDLSTLVPSISLISYSFSSPLIFSYPSSSGRLLPLHSAF